MSSPGRDVLTFGETMLRFTPPAGLRLAQGTSFDIFVGGTESNVASTLACLGASVTWVSRLPDQQLGRRVAAEIQARGVDVSHGVWTSPDERLGTFFAEDAADPRPGTVIYDRAGSAASRMTPTDLPDSLFDSHRHLHVTGITPALSKSCAETVADAVRRAKGRGMSVSLDVNYRARLWSPEAAATALTPLLSQVDVAFCSCDDASRLFGIKGDDTEVARGLQTRFSVSLAVVSAGDRGAVAAQASGEAVAVSAIPVSATVGRFGSGDALAGGFLALYLAGRPVEDALRVGVAAATIKRTIPGDMLIATRDEIETVAAKEQRAWR